MNAEITAYIEQSQRGKVGIYPYHVALEVCARFGVPLSVAQAAVQAHIRAVLTAACEAQQEVRR